MKRLLFGFVTILAVAGLIVSCGKKVSDDTDWANTFLPETIEMPVLTRTTPIEVFSGLTLSNHIAGGTDLYHQCNFESVASTSYSNGAEEVLVDLLRFATQEDAYGLFSSLRNANSKSINLGVEGLSTRTGVEFVKGRYLARLVGLKGFDENFQTVFLLARDIETRLPGSLELPEAFSLLPKDGRVAGYEKYTAGYFLGHTFLTNVYSGKYESNGVKFTLFVAEDESGDKFRQWSLLHPTDDKAAELLAGLSFDEGFGLVGTGLYDGTVVAGLKSGYLVGVVGYDARTDKIFKDWIASFDPAKK